MISLRAFLVLLGLSFRRLLWSFNTMMVLVPLLGCVLFVLRRRFDKISPNEQAIEAFGTFLVFIFSSFLIPICALGFGTTALGAEREEQTLVFLYCLLAGSAGAFALKTYWLAILAMTTAYLGLFHLFAVAFRHPTMLALVYALFMELFVANLPGSIKQLAINYYGRSLLYSLGSTAGLKIPRGFETIPAAQAYWTLGSITIGSLALALVLFQWKEYRDVN